MMMMMMNDQKNLCISDAAASYKSWIDSPSSRPKRELDLRLHPSLITNGDCLAMMRSTTLPIKKRKIEFSLTDNSSEKEYRHNKGHMEYHFRGISSVSIYSDTHSRNSDSSEGTSSTMTTESTGKPAQKEKEVANPSIFLQGVKQNKLDDLQDIAGFAEAAIDAKPLAFFDGEQVVNMCPARYKEKLSGNRYNCNECDKSFSSHQALGGHKTSHSKRSARPQEKKQGPIVTGVHRCKICGQTFPIGQALGGHKRLHYVMPSKAPSTSATSASPTSQENAPCVKKIFSFDLNQLPEEEADKDYSLDLSL